MTYIPFALTALALFFFSLPKIVCDPFMQGDAGYRLDHAGGIIVTVADRVWLPFVQMHIWAFFKCGLPIWAFKFIPLSYFLIAVFFLGLLARRILPRGLEGLLVSLFIMLCFYFHPTVNFNGFNLYQEIVEIALFYVLLYGGMLELRKKWPLLAIATLALLTRETFFVYLLVITLINYKKILSDKMYFYTFLWLWCIPVIWISVLEIKLWHFSAVPWVIMRSYPLPERFFENMSGLLSILKAQRCGFFLFSLAGTVFLMAFLKKAQSMKPEQGHFEAAFKKFSLFSLAVIYGSYTVLSILQTDTRIVIQLLEQMFIWAAVLYKEAGGFTFKWRVFFKVLLISGLVSGVVWPDVVYQTGGGHPEEGLRFYDEVNSIVKNYYPASKPAVCVRAREFWGLADGAIIESVLYAPRTYTGLSRDLTVCDMVIAPSRLGNTRFFLYDQVPFERGPAYIYLKRNALHALPLPPAGVIQ